jgi:enamine deaminase RidA (YjgF/YER057c/UK114 family)
MEVTDSASRRSLIRSFFASAAAATAGLFGVAHAQTPAPDTAPVKRTSSDAQAAGDKPPLFSGWVTYGNLVFVAGKGEHGPGDIGVHTTSVLNQIEAELKKNGSSMDKVLKVNVYLHDLRDYDGMNAAFRGRFGANPPVRTTVACYGGIPGSSLVEIDCIASR